MVNNQQNSNEIRWITQELIKEVKKIQHLIEPEAGMYCIEKGKIGEICFIRYVSSGGVYCIEMNDGRHFGKYSSQFLKSYTVLPDLRWLVRKLRNLTDELGWDFKFGPVEDGFWWVLVYDRERNRIPFEADTLELVCLKTFIELKK